MNARIIYNAIRTPDGTTLESRHVYDYKTHTDKNGEVYMVDGGQEYLRRSCNTHPAEELSVCLEDGHDVVREALSWGTYGIDGNEALKYVKLKDMSVDHIMNCLKNVPRIHPNIRIAFEDEIAFREKNK